MKRHILTLNEFVSTQAEPAVKPTTKPATPAPSRPSPIRRDKPAVAPVPKAEAEDVVERLLQILREKSKKIQINTKKMKAKYGK